MIQSYRLIASNLHASDNVCTPLYEENAYRKEPCHSRENRFLSQDRSICMTNQNGLCWDHQHAWSDKDHRVGPPAPGPQASVGIALLSSTILFSHLSAACKQSRLLVLGKMATQPGAVAIQDESRLAQLGYKQELKRDWTVLHNFGVSFSVIVSES